MRCKVLQRGVTIELLDKAARPGGYSTITLSLETGITQLLLRSLGVQSKLSLTYHSAKHDFAIGSISKRSVVT